jgi:hypothetical protein
VGFLLSARWRCSQRNNSTRGKTLVLRSVQADKFIKSTTRKGTDMTAAEKEDPRALLAKMEAERNDAQEKAKKAEEEYETKSKELLSKLRADDLADVIAKCQMHGFTLTDVKKGLKTKGAARKSTPRKSAARKTAPRRKKPAA